MRGLIDKTNNFAQPTEPPFQMELAREAEKKNLDQERNAYGKSDRFFKTTRCSINFRWGMRPHSILYYGMKAAYYYTQTPTRGRDSLPPTVELRRETRSNLLPSTSTGSGKLSHQVGPLADGQVSDSQTPDIKIAEPLAQRIEASPSTLGKNYGDWDVEGGVETVQAVPLQTASSGVGGASANRAMKSQQIAEVDGPSTTGSGVFPPVFELNQDPLRAANLILKDAIQLASLRQRLGSMTLLEKESLKQFSLGVNDPKEKIREAYKKAYESLGDAPGREANELARNVNSIFLTPMSPCHFY